MKHLLAVAGVCLFKFFVDFAGFDYVSERDTTTIATTTTTSYLVYKKY